VPDRHPDHDLLAELEPVAERLLDRHLSMAKEWMPHQYVPWRLGRRGAAGRAAPVPGSRFA
jgi:acyl-[acyl-carrier-protein] desaturase